MGGEVGLRAAFGTNRRVLEGRQGRVRGADRGRVAEPQGGGGGGGVPLAASGVTHGEGQELQQGVGRAARAAPHAEGDLGLIEDRPDGEKETCSESAALGPEGSHAKRVTCR